MWYSRETAPEPGNRFRLRVRCVRACVRAKLRVRDDSAVARVGRTNLSVVRPAVRHPRSRDTFFAFGLGLSEDVQLSLTSVFVYRSR